jgi:GAF domain-containing protein
MTETPTSRDERGIEHAAWSQAWLRHTLGEIVWQIRQLLDVSACVFQALDPQDGVVRPAAAWFATEEVRQAMAGAEPPTVAGAPLAVRSWAVRTTGGRSLGELMICSAPPARPLGEDDFHAMAVFADLAALALERAELLDREERRASTEVLLNEAAHAVTRSLQIRSVYRAIIDQAALLTGATKVLLARVEPATEDLRVVTARGMSARIASARFRSGEGMIGRVARTGEPYLSRAADADQWLTAIVESERIRSFIHVPISLGPRLFGVLSVSDETPDRFDEHQLKLLMALARIAAGAIANALDFEREQRIAAALTRGFVAAPAPELPGVELGLVYQPAGRELGGGDVFGAWTRRKGEVVVLVGDVAGKGLEVAALSAMARFFVEARAWDTEPPSDVLAEVHALLYPRLPGGSFVSAFLGVLSGRRLRYANAGHSPALLVRGDGAVDALASTGLPLGVVEDAGYEEHELLLGPGDRLFVATDGLVEARRGERYFGDERLPELLSAHARSLRPQPFVELLARELEAWAPEVDDDVLILAARPR